MRSLMLDVEKKIYNLLELIPKIEKQAGLEKNFEKMLKTFLIDQNGTSWDISEEELVRKRVSN